MTEEVEQLRKKVDDIALRGASKEDLARIEKLIKEGSSPAVTPPVVLTPPPTTLKTDESEELKQYRELERQQILKELPKEVIEEFKLTDKPLTRVKEVSRLHKAVSKKDVGVTPPPPSDDRRDKVLQWNPLTGKNELC